MLIHALTIHVPLLMVFAFRLASATALALIPENMSYIDGTLASIHIVVKHIDPHAIAGAHGYFCAHVYRKMPTTTTQKSFERIMLVLITHTRDALIYFVHFYF